MHMKIGLLALNTCKVWHTLILLDSPNDAPLKKCLIFVFLFFSVYIRLVKNLVNFVDS